MTQKIQPENVANLIIAGVNKAGSTSLFHYLTAHPDICGSIDKETCYFLPLLYGQPIAPIAEYEAQFKHCSGSKYRLEATPGYINGGEKMADTISKSLKNVKIIIILKNPTDRLASFYKRKKATLQLPQDLSFREYVKRCSNLKSDDLAQQKNHLYSALATGVYANFLEPWLTLFESNIKIVFFDDLQANAASFMEDIARWLQIDSNFYSKFDFDVKNKSMNYRNQLLQQIAVNANQIGKRFWRSNPAIKKNLTSLYYKVNGTAFAKNEIDLETMNFLNNYYQAHNQRLQQMLENNGMTMKMPTWLEQVNELA